MTPSQTMAVLGGLWLLFCFCIGVVIVLRMVTVKVTTWIQTPTPVPPDVPDPVVETKTEAEKQQRDDAIVSPEILYNANPEIEERFPRTRFEEYCKRHFSPERSLAYVLARSAQLIALINQHIRKVEPQADEDVVDDQESAREMIERYYAPHADLLKDVYPRVLLEATMRKDLPNGAAPTHYWMACEAIIATLRTLISEEKERKHKAEAKDGGRADELRSLNRRLDRLRASLEKVRKNEVNAPIEVVENDAEQIEEDIRLLEEDRDKLLPKV